MDQKVVPFRKNIYPHRTYRIKSKFRLCLFITFMLLILVFLASIIFKSGNAMTTVYTKVQLKTICVERGDTLWGIARRYRPNEVDIRDFIAQIMDINGLKDPVIHINQLLSVPVYNDENILEQSTVGYEDHEAPDASDASVIAAAGD
ncbi:MAG TPA: LysM peptidoglycan-binding domain-containing protein [Candidatus Atribacteria bacterium]|nr:LysM peptidoglycan-binding domain-containing protein [Candidatus Atribacteria bacterium]